VQQLRHFVLDPARLINEDHQLSPQDFEDKNIHMAAFLGSDVVGTARLDLIQVEPLIYEVRKMAVHPTVKKRGIGRRVLEAALSEADARGSELVTLDARKEAILFFERVGFELTGECIVHADGVPNYVMRRVVKL
jgi:predicted N-acetyltransferase YhbS